MFEIVKKEEEMLADRIRVENLPSYHIGMEKGVIQGVVQGVKQGLVQGVKQGLVQGVNQGLVQGRKQERQQSLKIRKNELIEGIWLLIKLKFQIPKKDFYPLLEKIPTITRLKEIRNAIFKIDNIEDIKNLMNDKI